MNSDEEALAGLEVGKFYVPADDWDGGWIEVSETEVRLWAEVKYRRRRCMQCGERVLRDQPDPCLGWLPSVRFACCGHGMDDGYILFTNGKTLRFPGGLVADDLNLAFDSKVDDGYV